MNVLYDYQIFVAQKFGGISRYFVDLMAGMRKKEGVLTQLKVLGKKNTVYQTIIQANLAT